MAKFPAASNWYARYLRESLARELGVVGPPGAVESQITALNVLAEGWRFLNDFPQLAHFWSFDLGRA